MPAFAYRAVAPSGETVRATEESSSEEQLTADLGRRGLLVLEVGERSVRAWRRRGRRGGQVLELTRALASLLSAGVPLSKALELGAEMVGSGTRDAASALRQQVEAGVPLHSALRQHEGFFGAWYAGLVRAGERSGDLAGAFTRLEAYLESQYEFRARLLTAALYPVILVSAGIGAVGLLTLFVLPRFADLLVDSGASLSTSTAMLLSLSQFVSNHWALLGAGVVVTAVVVAGYLSTSSGQAVASRLVLAMPVVGEWRRQVLGGRFARLAAVLLGGGAPLLEALEAAGASMGDPVARAEIERARFRVREGSSLQAALAECGALPDLLVQLVALGEQSGDLERFLEKAADLFEARAERMAERLVSLAEPAMIIVFGTFIGFVALALLQAVYGVNAGTLVR